jgi:hypothetical protein
MKSWPKLFTYFVVTLEYLKLNINNLKRYQTNKIEKISSFDKH